MAQALPFVYQAAVGIAISYAAGKLLEDDVDTPIIDNGPSPTVERGTPINLLIGRERLGPIYTWYGSRFSDDEDVDGGKGLGGGGGEQTIWYEEGWHVICVGPARRLWQIKDNGKPIFVGPIDPTSHPSGTTIDLGDGSSFVMYWGEADQPENTVLGAPGKLTEAGLSSRHPYCCYVHWIFKRLGTTPVWPRLTYDIEVWPFDTKLAATASWFPASRTLVGPVQTISDTQDGAAGVAFVEFGEIDNDFKPSGWARIEGNTIPDGDYRIDSVVKTSTTRQIILGQSVTGLTDAMGTIQAYVDNDDDGANAAHVLYQLLFVPPPHGRGLNPANWNMASLEQLGVVCYLENLRTTVSADGDKTIKSCIADVMQDIGAMLYRDARTGLLGFRVIRESDEVAVLEDVHICGDPPEVQNVVESRQPASRKLFTFKDRLHDYLEYPIQIDDDGAATLDQSYGREHIPMSTVRDLTTAWTVAKRRDQESYSGDMPVVVRSKGEGCLLEPGMQVTIPDLDMVMIVMDSERRDFLSGEVELSLIPNYYGVPASNAVVYAGGGEAGEVEESGEDLEVIPFEVPQRLNNSGAMRVGVGRIRSAATVSKAKIHLSEDDVSFFPLGQDASIHTGGKLDAAVLADSPSLIDSGPTFLAEGVDIEGALDLSAVSSLFEWQSGRQVAIVGDGTNYELWFVRWIESLGGGQYRMREVIRHRFCTTKQAWPIDTPVVIFDRDQVRQFTDLILVPQDDFFFKSQPIGPSPITLDDLASFELDAYGQGVRPLPVTALRGTDEAGIGANCYVFPNSPIIKWGYRAAPGPSSASPAELGAGDPKFANPPCDGAVRLRFTDPNNSDALLRQVELPADVAGQYTYDSTDLFDDFGLDAEQYVNAVGRLYLSSGVTSPTPTDPNVLANSPSGAGVFTNFPSYMLLPTFTGTPTNTVLGTALANGVTRSVLFVVEPGAPGLTTFPTGTWTLVIKLNTVTASGGTIAVGVGARILRLNSLGQVVQAGNIINSDSYNAGVDTLPKTFTMTIPTTTFTVGSPTDRLCLQVVVSDLGAQTSTTAIGFEIDSGASYLEKADLVAPLKDFDVEASIVKGAYQSDLESISMKARTTA